MKHKLKLGSIGIALLLTSMTSCALSSGPIEGQVLEDKTGRPIADAIVVVFWYGTWSKLVESYSACYHTEAARTDANGRYHIQAWTRPWSFHDMGVSDKVVNFVAHKAGYTNASNFRNDKFISLTPFIGTEDEYLDTIGSNFCDDQASQKNLIPLFDALTKELSAMPETPKQKMRLDGVKGILNDLIR